MAALPYMQLYVADYLADTAYLDVIESGAYLHLLMNYWQTGKPLPNDDKRLARIAKCTDEQWLNVRSTVVEYFVEQENVLIHNRVEEDLLSVNEKQSNASKAGKASAAARKKAKSAKKATAVERTLNGSATNVDDALNHTDTDTDTDTDIKEKEKEKPTRAKKFISPSLIETDKFASSEKINLTGFFDYYESNGWLVGKNKMKNWRASARGWSNRQKTFTKQPEKHWTEDPNAWAEIHSA